MTPPRTTEPTAQPRAMNQPAPPRAMEKIVPLVLAAGASRRLGVPKQLVIKQGVSLLRGAVIRACELGAVRPLVVLGAEAARMQQELVGLAATVVLNPQWQEGMASSLRAGLRAMPPDAEALLVLTCDQWRLSTTDLVTLLEAFGATPLPMAAATYQGVLGVPAIFARALFPELLGLRNDEGARRLLRARPADVVAVEMPNAAEDLDVLESMS